MLAFGLLSLNQVMSNALQAAGIFRTNHTKSTLKGRIKQNDRPIDAPICRESFNQVLKNCSQSLLKSFSSLKVSLTNGIPKINSRSLFWRPFRTKSLPWMVSNKSAVSFFENKHESHINSFQIFPNIAISTKFQRSILQNHYCCSLLVLGVSARSCKTESEKARNQNLILASSPHEAHNYRLFDSETGTETIKEEEQKREVTVAKDSTAGNGGRSPDKYVKWLRVIEQLLNILLIFLMIICFTMFVLFVGFSFTFGGLGRSGSQLEVDPEEISITFADVKGVDEAKQELKYVVEFLKHPEKFTALGAKLPRGVLLVGPPGTGKTLLARAVAGEAGVPFFCATGSEFDEIFVGQGAKRVRNLFSTAKKQAPCVIFIDEIDSIGSKRTGTVPYESQTINQLLSEMDGFHKNDGVIVLGATNRRDDLDKALLRPGRFDVEVAVPVPDYVGRKEILELYLNRIVSQGINVEKLARGTTGFTGADLENLVNQAALLAAVSGAKSVSMKHIEEAKDKVLMGPERKSRILDEEANKITAYHEGGHAIVAFYTKDSHPLHKVTIRHRGSSLGHTACIPEKESYHVTKSQLLAMLDMMMGGRAAEELIFGPDKITSGASSDLKQATSIATLMVKEWGMSEKVGLRTYIKSKNDNELSPATAELIDSEINKLMTESYERAKNILKTHQREHKLLAENLLKHETLDARQVEALLKDKHVAGTSRTV